MDEKKVKVSQIEEHVNKSIKNKSVKDWTSGKRTSDQDKMRLRNSGKRTSDQDKMRLRNGGSKMLGVMRSMLNEGRLRKGKYNAH
jgi:hypothetical protein